MKAILERKPDSFTERLKNIEITAIIQLSNQDFINVLMHPLYNYDFIKQKAHLMGCKNGVYQCLLLVGEGRTDGLLVESEGAAYCRYAAYLPDATFIQRIMEKEQLYIQSMYT